MKHLKVRAELSKCRTKVKLTILEQTHLSSEFGKYEPCDTMFKGHTYTFRHKSVRIISEASPSYINRGPYSTDRMVLGVTSWVRVRGCVTARDSAVVDIPIKEWPGIKEAIEAYNEWGANQ